MLSPPGASRQSDEMHCNAASSLAQAMAACEPTSWQLCCVDQLDGEKR